MEGQKELLGIWVSQNEGADFCSSLANYEAKAS
jgi:transposase-like protein